MWMVTYRVQVREGSYYDRPGAGCEYQYKRRYLDVLENLNNKYLEKYSKPTATACNN